MSESTKNKLQAFQFDGRLPDDTSGDPPKPLASILGKENEQINKTSPRAAHRTGKSATTPVGRPSWQDLLGNHKRPAEENHASPSERLTWRPANSPVRRQRKKRARSSSPILSPGPSSSAGPNIDLKGLTGGLKTPRAADPASELWAQFSRPGTDTPVGIENPFLAHLMVSSSPRPNKDGSAPRSDKSLRKTLSCGSNWPKRRRVERVDEEQRVAGQGSPRQDAKSTMVSTLLETGDTELRKTRLAEAQIEQVESPSPRKKSSRKANPEILSNDTISLIDLAGGSDAAGNPEKTVEVSSDYGDDDFDDDTLMELDAVLNIFQGPEPTAVSVPENAPVVSVPAAAEEDFDEFDVDDDFFDGAEDLLAEVEAKHLSQVPKQQNVEPVQIEARPQQADLDDEFGDDFGEDFDPEAVELAATQGPISALSSASHVRSFR